MTDVSGDVEKGEPSYTVGGNANWCSHSGKEYWGSFLRFLKKLKIELPYDPKIVFHKVYKNTDSKGYMHSNVYSSIINNSQIMERIQMSINWWMDKEEVVLVTMEY